MSSVRLEDVPAVDRDRPDTNLWEEVNTAELSAREKRYYAKRKSAVQAYLTTQEHLNEIANRHHLSSKTLKRLIKKCLMQHEDGNPWGYRALLPGVTVIDHTPKSIPEESAQETPPELDGALSENAADPATDPHLNSTQPIEDQPVVSLPDTEASTSPQFVLEQEQTILTDANSQDDEEDTAKREALNIAQTNAAPPVTPIPPSLQGEDEIATEETSVEFEEPHTADAASLLPDALDQDSNTSDENAHASDTTPDMVSLFPDASGQEVDAADTIPDATDKDQDVQRDASMEAQVDGLPAEDVSAENVSIAEVSEELAPYGGADEAALGAINRPLLEPSDVTDQPRAGADGAALHRPSRSTSAYWIHPHATGAPSRKAVFADRRIRKRWVRSVQKQRTERRSVRIISAAVVAALLFVILIPVGSGLAAYSAYTHIRNVTMDGVNNLLAVKDLVPISKSDPTTALNPDKLQTAQKDLTEAQSDFLELQQLVNRPDIASAVQQFAPEYSGKLGMARNLVQVGIDVSRMGNELIGVALLGANILHGSPLSSGSNKPLVTATDVSNAEGALVHAQYYINDIQTQMSQVAINELPISDKQKTELTSVLTLLPKAQSLITQVQGVTGIVSWLLGIGQPRRFLVQTMDSAELRPSGGFTGQYGILSISNGRMAPFSLQDVTELDYAGNGVELNRSAPPQYRSWMTFGFWGLRDANLSGDYPTSAKLAMQVYQEEGGGPVDGDISFTPTLIAHVLDVTGPIQVPEYHETITAKNLEDKLHYYQQNSQAIQVQRQKTGTNNASTRKAFTSLLGKILLDKVRHLSIQQLMTLAQKAVKDIQSHDLEIYFSDPQAEAWLVGHGYADGMDRFTRQDGFMVVQSNISISKASQYVHTTEQDNIVLDAQGGVTHTLTITLNYKQTGPVYGYDTYADYIRVYAPQNAQLLYGDGFDTGKPLCGAGAPSGSGSGNGNGSGSGGDTGGTGGPTPGGGNGGVPKGCEQYKTMFPSDARYCPSGNYSLGQNAYVPGKGFTNWPIDSLGAPTELTSDMPGRAMWGGLTVTPKNCISTITLSWYVPHVVKHTAGQVPYALLVQKQGGYIPTVQISIDTSAIKGLKPYNFSGNLIADKLFSLATVKKK